MPRNYEYQQLIALGISPHIIKEATISPSSYARLYTLLKDFMDPKMADETLQINAPWQLQLLCKKIDILPHLNISQATDNLGLNIAHYLALADSVEGLQWVRDNHPILLTSTNNFGISIAHSASFVGSLNALKWIKRNEPALLIREDSTNGTIAHQAVWGGQVGVLTWLKSIKYSLFSFRDTIGMTLAHRAVESNQPEVLDWLNSNYPELLVATEYYYCISQCAVIFKQLRILDWINNNQPNVLSVVAQGGKNIAHFAAEYGFVEGLDWIQIHRPHLINAVESSKGRNIAHWAAEQGQLPVLLWIHQNCPNLISALDSHHFTVAHSAVYAPNNEVLDWLHENYHYLLTKLGINGLSIGHMASQQSTIDKLVWIHQHCHFDFLKTRTTSGKTIAHTATTSPAATVILDWIKYAHDDLLSAKDLSGFSLAHEAAFNKRLDVLQWIKKEVDYERLDLSDKTVNSLSIKDYAAMSGDIEFLNKVILLSPDPHVLFHVGNSVIFINKVVGSLLKVLDINFALTDVEVPLNTDDKIVNAIISKIERNQAIAKATHEFLILAGSCFDKTNPVMLPHEMLFHIFKTHLPENIPDKEITRAFNKIMGSFSPENRFKTRQRGAVAFIKREIFETESVDKQLTRLNQRLINWNLLNSSAPKINALQKIQQIVESKYDTLELLKLSLIDFYQANKEFLTEALYKGPCFFKPQNEKSLTQIWNHLCDIINITRDDLELQAPLSQLTLKN